MAAQGDGRASGVHYGPAEHLRNERAVVLNGAYDLHPERFVRKPPDAPKLPVIAWIIQSKEDTTTTQWFPKSLPIEAPPAGCRLRQLARRSRHSQSLRT